MSAQSTPTISSKAEKVHQYALPAVISSYGVSGAVLAMSLLGFSSLRFFSSMDIVLYVNAENTAINRE